MNASSLLIVLALLGGITNEQDHSATAEAKEATYEISARAHTAIDPLNAQTLANDEAFIRTLKAVLNNPDFTDADKADAFFLMRMKFDWAFIGAVSVPPGFTYDRVFGMYLQTYEGYRKALGEEHDVKGLLEVAKLAEPQDIARASSALLLASILDPEATQETVIALCDQELVAASAAPPITIHHLALCATLCSASDAGMTKLAALTSRFRFEESQEDVLLALAYSDSAKTRDLIEQFAEEHAPHKFDQAVQLALTVVRTRMGPEAFKSWIDPLIEKVETDEVRQAILKWAAAEPQPVGPFHPRSGVMKLWDGFNATVYDNGTRLTYRETFSGFMTRE